MSAIWPLLTGAGITGISKRQTRRRLLPKEASLLEKGGTPPWRSRRFFCGTVKAQRKPSWRLCCWLAPCCSRRPLLGRGHGHSQHHAAHSMRPALWRGLARDWISGRGTAGPSGQNRPGHCRWFLLPAGPPCARPVYEHGKSRFHERGPCVWDELHKLRQPVPGHGAGPPPGAGVPALLPEIL